MDLGSIFLILALLLLVALFVARPFLEKERSAAQPVIKDPLDHELSALLSERDRLLNAIQELDFDHALGKIPEEDYPPQRGVLLQHAAGVLRRLDELQPMSAAQSAEDRLEAVIAARRADAAVPALAGAGASAGNGRKAGLPASPDDSLEAELANRRRERREKAAGFCHRCGGPQQKSDAFCPKCGAKI
ncbi:MAG: zinc ribbon domain-containing protein [Chloroflexota bacterium]